MGNELIPLGKVKDFSPYISKIQASGAQAVITGNWGPDLTLLLKAGMDAGLNVKYYAFAAPAGGAPTAIGPRGDGRVITLQGFNENVAAEKGDAELRQWVEQFRATHDFDFYAAGFRTTFEFLQAAIDKAGSTDAVKVAEALEVHDPDGFVGPRDHNARGGPPAAGSGLRHPVLEGREV